MLLRPSTRGGDVTPSHKTALPVSSVSSLCLIPSLRQTWVEIKETILLIDNVSSAEIYHLNMTAMWTHGRHSCDFDSLSLRRMVELVMPFLGGLSG